MSRKNQTSELKSRVMEVALGHFSEVGIERTNVSNILNDAGCSVGSLYHHFGNKEGIAEALFIDGVNQFNSRLLEALLPRRTASNGIKAIVTFCCEWVTDQPELAGFLLSREVTLSDNAKLELRKMDREFGQSIYDWFVPHVRSGALLELPTSMYVPLICGSTLEYSRLWISGRNNRSPGAVASILAEAAWQSIKSSP
jgi:AcrR family transcriptional regulator